jgi:hypothetical protein
MYQLTRDGCELDCITMKTWKWGDTLTSKQRKLSKDLLLHEIPRIFLAGLVVLDLKIISENVVTLDGVTCSKTVFSFRRGGNVIENGVLICCPRRRRLITIAYQGTDRYYFESQREAFEDMVRSVAFKGKK